MRLEEALGVLNDMEKAGLLSHYAVGGGMAALFYTEPVLTFDLDVFALLPDSDAAVLTLTPIYAYLADRGYRADHEHVTIAGFPVQIIPAYNKLVSEAVMEARDITYGQTATRVLRAEHLVAIMLQTGRPKDLERLRQLLDEADLDQDLLVDILRRHGLTARLQRLMKDGDA